MAEQPIHSAVLVSEEQLRQLIKESVHEAFVAVGMDANDPIELQKDLAYLRSWRELVQKGGTRAFLTAVGFITLGLLAAALVGLGVPLKVLSLFGIH